MTQPTLFGDPVTPGQKLHLAYRRALSKRWRTAARALTGEALSLGDLDAFIIGCRVDAWVGDSQIDGKALVRRLVRAGLIADPKERIDWGGRTFILALLTPNGRGLWWRMEEAAAVVEPLRERSATLRRQELRQELDEVRRAHPEWAGVRWDGRKWVEKPKPAARGGA